MPPPPSTSSPLSATAAVITPDSRIDVPAPAIMALDSVQGIATFKCAVMTAVLVITVISALLPLWISRNGTTKSRQLLANKLPFVTAGVFIGSGLLHLLPDAVKMYSKVIVAAPDMFAESWTREFPTVYLLSAIGCMIVWSVDLLNLGDSGKMMAVASAARPNYETTMCRVQIPAVTSFGGSRRRSASADGYYIENQQYGACACDSVSSPANTAFHRGTRAEETTLLLTTKTVKVVADTAVRTYSVERIIRSAREEDGLLAAVEEADDDTTIQTEATISDHVVFSGQSTMLPYLLALLFSIHSLIAGFALGVNNSSSKTAIATAIAIFSHKVIEAMSVGANFARAKESIGHKRAVAVLLLYSLMTPAGIVFGMLLSESLQGTTALVVESAALSIASGSFVYLAFHEMSEEHATQETPSLEKIFLFGAGLFSMAVLATWA